MHQILLYLKQTALLSVSDELQGLCLLPKRMHLMLAIMELRGSVAHCLDDFVHIHLIPPPQNVS